MTYLVDTHALLWWLFNDSKLSPTARGIIADPAHTIYVSSASAWEISTKHRLGKLPAARTLVQDIAGWVSKARFEQLAITIAHAQRAGSFAQPHRDPFDRMLAAQSMIEDVPLLSCDEVLSDFGVKRIW